MTRRRIAFLNLFRICREGGFRHGLEPAGQAPKVALGHVKNLASLNGVSPNRHRCEEPNAHG